MDQDEVIAADAVVDTSAPVIDPAPAPAPAAPQDHPAKPVSVRDSVRAAYDQLSKKGGDEPKPGEPGEPAKPTGQLSRDPATGRFAAQPKPADPAVAARPGADPAPAEKAGGQAPGAPAVPGGGPPPGWSVQSKASWDSLKAAFPHVAADVEKRQQETEAGLAALRDYKDVKPYAEMAQQSGTTLAAALQRYTTMEQLARRDPAQGMMSIAHNMGLSKAQAGQLFAHLAGALGARPTNGHQSNGGLQPFTSGTDQNDPLAEVLGPILEQRLGPLAQKLGVLETHLTRAQQADQNAMQRGVSEAIEKFATDPAHRYFPDLQETISRLFETGMVERTADPVADLTKAYEMAAYQHPEVREALVSERLKAKADEGRTKAVAAQKRAVSLTGHPAGGAAAPPRPAVGMSAHDSVRAAFDQLRSGV